MPPRPRARSPEDDPATFITVLTPPPEDTLSARMRRFAGVSIVAWIAFELYLTVVPLLASVPRWMFEASRLLLLIAGAGALAFTLIAAVRNRNQLRGRALIWFALAIAAALLCLLRWLAMTFPLFA